MGVLGVMGGVDAAATLGCAGKGDWGENGDLWGIGIGLGVLGGIAYGSELCICGVGGGLTLET